jgi:hypothetical protein
MIHNPNNKYAIEARKRAEELEKRIEEEKKRAEVVERSRQEEKIEMERRIAELEARLAQAEGTGHSYSPSNQLTFQYSSNLTFQLIPLNRPIQSFMTFC